MTRRRGERRGAAEDCGNEPRFDVRRSSGFVLFSFSKSAPFKGDGRSRRSKASRPNHTLEGNKASYTVQLKEKAGEWGDDAWAIDGIVHVKKHDDSEKTDQNTAKKEHHEPQRNIASWTAPTIAPLVPPSATSATPATPETPASPSETQSPPVSQEPAIKFSGLLDANYVYNFNSPSSLNPINPYLPTPQNEFRANDAYHNSFALNMVELSVQRKAKEVGFQLDLDFGQYSDWLAAVSVPPSSTLVPGTFSDEISKHIGQAYVTWNPSFFSALTLNVGKMATFIGYEGPKAKDNFNYSRSLLFQLGVPFWHTGANASFSVIPKKLTVALHVYNGWNNLFSNNSGKHIGLQTTYTPNETMTANFGLLSGPSNAGDPGDKTTIYNFNFQWIATPSLTLALDSIHTDWAQNPLISADAKWDAVEILAKLAVTPKWYWSPRLEIFSDPNGVATGNYPGASIQPQTLTEGTLTTAYTWTAGLETRLEGRLDHSTASSFQSPSGAKNTQFTTSVSFLYSF